MTTSDAAARDRLYFQQQRELLASTHHAWAAATGLSEELRRRLDDLDELAESIDIEEAGDNIRHRYTGSALCWMQQRMGEHVRAVRGAAERLQVAAEDMAEAANDAGGMPRLAHVARGHMALVAEAHRVVASCRPESERLHVDWTRIDAVVAGIERLEDLDRAELREKLVHNLCAHEQRKRDLRAAGTGKLADRVNSDPLLREALAHMRSAATGDSAPPAEKVDKPGEQH